AGWCPGGRSGQAAAHAGGRRREGRRLAGARRDRVPQSAGRERGDPGTGAAGRRRDRVRPDSAARLLARGRSRTLGVVFTVQQTFHTNLIEGIYPEAERLGYEVPLSGATRGRSEEKAVEALLSHRCEAVILLGSFFAEPAF